MNTNNLTHLRGEIWEVELFPAVGAEMKKKRPSVIINSNAVGILPIKLIAPITEWNDRYNNYIWHVKIVPDSTNGLTKISSVDTLQIVCRQNILDTLS